MWDFITWHTWENWIFRWNCLSMFSFSLANNLITAYYMLLFVVRFCHQFDTLSISAMAKPSTLICSVKIHQKWLRHKILWNWLLILNSLTTSTKRQRAENQAEFDDSHLMIHCISVYLAFMHFPNVYFMRIHCIKYNFHLGATSIHINCMVVI